MSEYQVIRNSKNVFRNFSSRNTVFFDNENFISETSVRNVYNPLDILSKANLNISQSLSLSELLNPDICCHPQCSFAYNITGDIKRDSLITQCLPQSTYRKLARFWNLDPNKTPRLQGNTCKLQNVEEENAMLEEYIRNVERDLGIKSDISEDLQVDAESIRRSVIKVAKKAKKKKTQFLKFSKIKGDVDVEEMKNTNLREKAKNVTKQIIKNFLDWYQSLGGEDNDFVVNEDTLQELFQIGFDFPAAKALIVRIKEMPTIPEGLAILRNELQFATRYCLRKYLLKDIKKEKLPPKMFAFGRMLPKEKPTLRFKPPKNFVKETWLKCSRIPQDLDSMKTVWSGLEKLRSTIAFSNWLKNHPEIKPPPYLVEQGLLQINYEEWIQMYKGFEADMDVLETVPSASEQMSAKFEKSKLSFPSSRKFDSLESVN